MTTHREAPKAGYNVVLGERTSDSTASSPPAEADRKDVAGVFVALANVSRESVVDRRRYEWQVLIGICVGAGLAIQFVFTHRSIFAHSEAAIPVLIAGCLAACMTFYWRWEVPSTNAFRTDIYFKTYYSTQAERAIQGLSIQSHEEYDKERNRLPKSVPLNAYGTSDYFCGQTCLVAAAFSAFIVAILVCWNYDKTRPNRVADGISTWRITEPVRIERGDSR